MLGLPGPEIIQHEKQMPCLIWKSPSVHNTRAGTKHPPRIIRAHPPSMTKKERKTSLVKLQTEVLRCPSFMESLTHKTQRSYHKSAPLTNAVMKSRFKNSQLAHVLLIICSNENICKRIKCGPFGIRLVKLNI